MRSANVESVLNNHKIESIITRAITANHVTNLQSLALKKKINIILDLIEKEYFPPKSKILVIHTGGLQGINGINAILKQKNLTEINIDV